MQPALFCSIATKKRYLAVLAGSAALILTAGICLQAYRSYTSKPVPMAHTLEYNAVVEEHIDTAKAPRGEIDLAVVKQEVGNRFAVYQFHHQKLKGKWGYLNVFVDRQTGKTISRSLALVKGSHPSISLSSAPGCLTIPQLEDNYEVCIR